MGGGFGLDWFGLIVLCGVVWVWGLEDKGFWRYGAWGLGTGRGRGGKRRGERRVGWRRKAVCQGHMAEGLRIRGPGRHGKGTPEQHCTARRVWASLPRLCSGTACLQASPCRRGTDDAAWRCSSLSPDPRRTLMTPPLWARRGTTGPRSSMCGPSCWRRRARCLRMLQASRARLARMLPAGLEALGLAGR